MTISRVSVLAPALAATVLLAGCGGSGATSTPTPAASTAPSATVAPAQKKPPQGPGALQAEAASAAAGDVPDNQVFLTFRNRAAGYSLKYPEGWAQSGSGSEITFRDKSNVVRIVVAHAPAPTVASVRADVARLRGARVKDAPREITLGGAPAVKVVYSTESAPSPVTGKRSTLVVDRYYLGHVGKEAIVDLGTPQGVDNVDAYRLMIESFRWE